MKAFRHQHGFSLVELLVVVALIGIVTGMAIPMADSTSRGYRLKGDAQAVANMVSLAKMRAASLYTRTRLRADLAARSFRLEVWVPDDEDDKTVGNWVTEGGEKALSNGISFGFANRTTPPPNTQNTLSQSPLCSASDSLGANPVADTACIVFNSRGIPVDGGGDPAGGNALYITDGSTVYATTITATPLMRQWWGNGTTGDWVRQ